MVGQDGPPPPGGQGSARHDQAQEIPQEGQASKATYASKVTGSRNERTKLNVLDVYLDRKDNSVNFNLSKEELAKLLFKKMAVDPKSVIKVDTSGFGKIHIEFAGNVNLETMTNLPVFDIRNGLRTKFYRPHHRKDTLVTINWLDIETPDSLVSHVLGHFGKLKSNVQWAKFKKEENESSLAGLLNSILSGERQVWMEIDKPIPSYAIIDGRKAKIYHPGQRRTCARCQKTAEHCLGNSNAKLCDERGGDKVAVDIVWKDTLERVGYTEWLGGKEIELEENEVDTGDSGSIDASNKISVTKYPNCDGFVLSNLPDDTTDAAIEQMIEKVVLNGSEQVSILPSESSRKRFIKTEDKSLIQKIVDKLNNKSLKGRLIYCRPHIPTTPPKKAVPSETNEDTEAAKNKKDEQIAVTVTEAAIEAKKDTIPGLSETERMKSLKSAEKKKKALAAKERKKQKKEEKEAGSKKNMNREDFLKVDEMSEAEINEKFEFSDYSSDDAETFEDSKEDLSDEEFLTPIPFASKFGRRQAALSTSTPNLAIRRQPSKRSASSPGDEEANSKKHKVKSKLPTKQK